MRLVRLPISLTANVAEILAWFVWVKTLKIFAYAKQVIPWLRLRAGRIFHYTADPFRRQHKFRGGCFGLSPTKKAHFLLDTGAAGGPAAAILAVYFLHFLLDRTDSLWYNGYMKMTRSHFQALATMTADIIVALNATKDQTIIIMDEVIAVCKESNPNFDANRFDEWVQDILIGNS